ncbi:MAG TPA: hypothetical protein VH682_25420 [Gemmataceae bacterium]
MAGFRGDVGEHEETAIPLAADESGAEQPQAWEQIENGRYMPRRIRGSFRGRELG